MDWDGWRLVQYAPITHDMALQLIHHSVYSHPADHLLIEMARMAECPPCLKHVLELVYEADWQTDLLDSIRIELSELPAAQAFSKRFKGTVRQQEERIHVNYLEMKVMAGLLLGRPVVEEMLETLALHYAVDLRPSPVFLKAMEEAPLPVKSLLGLQHDDETEMSYPIERMATPPQAPAAPSAPNKNRTFVVDLPTFKPQSKREAEEEIKCLVPETPMKRASKPGTTGHLILETPPRLSIGGANNSSSSSSSDRNLHKLRRLELH